MKTTVYVKTYNAPGINEKEILRYAGAKELPDEARKLLASCIDEVSDKLSYKVCYAEFPVTFGDGHIDFGFARTESKDLMKNLSGCESVIFFAASIGIGIDRLIARYGSVMPSKALLLDAVGTERIESLADTFNLEVKAEKALCGKVTMPRFSCGYGDFPLSFQKVIFNVLDCPRKIGVSLNDSLLMSPAKSVTALIGISSQRKEQM